VTSRFTPVLPRAAYGVTANLPLAGGIVLGVIAYSTSIVADLKARQRSVDTGGGLSDANRVAEMDELLAFISTLTVTVLRPARPATASNTSDQDAPLEARRNVREGACRFRPCQSDGLEVTRHATGA